MGKPHAKEYLNLNTLPPENVNKIIKVSGIGGNEKIMIIQSDFIFTKINTYIEGLVYGEIVIDASSVVATKLK